MEHLICLFFIPVAIDTQISGEMSTNQYNCFHTNHIWEKEGLQKSIKSQTTTPEEKLRTICRKIINNGGNYDIQR